MKYIISSTYDPQNKIIILTEEELNNFLNCLHITDQFVLKTHIKFRQKNNNAETIHLLFFEKEIQLLKEFFDGKFYSNLESVLK